MKIKLFLKRSLVFSIAISIGVLFSTATSSSVSASSNTLNFQSKIVNLVDGTNIDTGSPACVVAGNSNDTCDFRVNIYDDPTAGNLLFSEDHINTEIGRYNGIFNLEINSICNVVSDTGTDGNWTDNADPCISNGGVDFSATDLWIEIEFDPTGTSTFSETFSRVEIRDVASARYAVSASYLDNLTSADFVQFRPGAVQTTTSANTLINLETTANTANPLLNINENGAGTPDLLRLQNTSTTVFQVANGGFTGIGAGATTAAWLDIGANTTTAAQLNLTPSAAVDVAAPNAGDLWFNGSNLYFDDGTTTFDLLAGSPCITCFHDGGDSFGALAVLGTNDNFSLAFETNGAEKMRLGADGTLGVATTTATSQVHIVTGGSGSTSGATTMTAVNGNSTFTTDAVITLNVGDYIVPNLQSTQSRVVTVGGTGTNFTVTPAFTANVTTRTFVIHRKGVTVEGARPLMALRNTQLGTQEWQLRVGALGPGSSSFDLFSQTTSQTALRIENDGDVLLGTDTNFGGIGNNSRLYVYGGDGGANIDVMGNAAQVDQATIELQSSDYSTSSASSRLQSYGVSGVGTTFGFANQYLGVLAFQEMDSALIATSNDTDLTFITDALVRATFDGTSGDLILTNDLAVNGGDISSTSATVNVFTSAGATTFNVGRTGATGTMNLMGGSADTGCTINGVTGDFTCTGNIVGGASGDFFEQGGNSFSANAVLGTNDNFSLSFETNGTTHATLSTAGDFTFNNDLAVNGGDLTTTAATFNLLNTNATTVNAFGATTTLNLAGGVGSTGCTIDGSGNIDCTGLFNGVDLTDVLLNGGNTFGGPVTFGSNDNFALNFETNNVTQMSISNAGDVTINNDLAVNGGDITTTNATANLFTTNATTINMGDAANTINFGGGSGSTGCTMDTTTGSIDCSGNGTFGGDVNVNGGDLITTAGTFNLVNAGATSINGFGAATTVNLGIAGASGTMNLMGGDASTGCTVDGTAGNFSCTNNATFGGDLAVNGGDITTTNATANIFNTNATTVNIGGASNTINLGGGDASTGCTIDATTGDLDCSGLINGVDLTNVLVNGGNTFGGPVILGSNDNFVLNFETNNVTHMSIGTGGDVTINNDLAVNGGDITTTNATANLFQTNATTVNIGGASNIINFGGGSGSTGCTMDTTTGSIDCTGNGTFGGDVNVNGGDLITSAATFNLINTNATTVNGFGAATTVNLGIAGASGTMNLMGGSASTGCTIDGTTGDLDCSGLINGVDLSQAYIQNGNTFGANAVLGTNDNFSLSLETNGTTHATLSTAGNLTLNNDLAINGGDLTTTAGTFNLVNTGATVINGFGAATTINLGIAGASGTMNLMGGDASTGCTVDGTAGNFSCTNNATFGGDLAVNGGDITTTNATANIFNTNATTVNIGGASNTINLGGGDASTGCTIDATTGDLDCSGLINGVDLSNVILQGGNTFGGAMTIGTNDNFGFNFETNGATQVAISNAGDVTVNQDLTVSGTTGIGTAANSASWLDIGANTTTTAQLNLSPSAAVDVSAPNAGDLWFNGTNLYFDDGTTTHDLLAGGACTTCFHQNGDSFGALAVLGTNDTFGLAFETDGTTRLTLDTSGHLTPNVDDTYDLGSTTNRFRDLYLGPATLNIGTSADDYDISFDTAGVGSLVFNEAGEDDDLRIEGDTEANLFFVDASTDRIGIGLNNPTALLSIQAATAAQSSLRIVSSAGVNPAAPNSGDLWWNGTNLNFRTATVNIDLLANCAISACFYQNGNTFGAGAVLGTNDAFGLAFETSGTTRLAIDAVGAITQTFPGTTTTGYTQVANSLTSGRGFDITSTSTAFTGDLHRIALTGNNAANTGDLLELIISGPASAARALFIENQGIGTSMRVNDVAADTTPFIIDNAGNVGVQYDTPGRSLDVFNDASINNNLVVQTDGGALYGSNIVQQDSFEIDESSFSTAWFSRSNHGLLSAPTGIGMSSNGRYVSVVEGGEQIRESSDFGLTWNLRGGALSWTSVEVSAIGKYQIATAAGSQLQVSSDYGVTWVAREAARTWDESAISADGRYITAVVGNGTPGFIYTSSDYGVTWTQRESSRLWNGAGMSSDGKHQAAVAFGGQIYVSSDYGVTWTARDANRNWSEGMVVSSNGQYMTAAVEGGNIYTSSDYGVTWTARESARQWSDTAMTSDGRIQFATFRTGIAGNDSFMSFDHGVTWTAAGDNFQDTVNQRFIAMTPNGKYLYVTQDNGNLRASIATSRASGGSLAINTVHDATSQVSVFRNAPAGTRQFGLRIEVDGNSDDARGIRIQANSDNCSTTGICRFIDIVDGDGTAIQSIRSNAGTLEFGGTSDERLKTDIAPTTIEGLQSLMGIVISDFRRIESEGKVETAGDLQTGFIAQNLLEAFPSAVYLEDTGYYSISTTRLLPLTMKAVQELNTKVDDNEVILETIGLTVDSQNVSLADLGDVVNTHATELLTLATADADQISLYTALETRVAGLETSVAALDLRLAAVEGARGGVNYQPQIDALSARVTAIENGTLKDTATILIDTSFVEVTFAQAFAEAPIITLTPIDYLSGYAISEVTEAGFRIIIAEPAVVDVVFNWVAVEK